MERNIKLTLSYIGTDYCGWQSQKNGRSIQKTVSEAIEQITGVYPKLFGCGRTDAGVHAKNYCCSFKTESNVKTDTFVKGLNAVLPKDISVKSAEEVSEDFNARFSVTGKTYEYYILNTAQRDPFWENRAYHYRKKLDEKVLNNAAACFLGEHDFAGFSSVGSSVKTTIRTITASSVRREGDMVIFSVSGNGFLYNMVRIMAGTLLAIAEGKIAAEELPEIINSCDRNRAGITAKAHGLYLSEVYYE